MKKLMAKVSNERISFFSHTLFNTAIDRAKENGLFVAIVKLRPRRKDNEAKKK